MAIDVAHNEGPSPPTPSSSLLSISSKEEEIFVDHFLFNISSIVDNVWLGASRDRRLYGGEFAWPDGTILTSPTTYANWGFSNPTEDLSKSCLELKSRENRVKNSWTIDPGTWYNVPCSKHNVVVCQYLIRSIPSPQLMSQLSKLKKEVENLKKSVSSLEKGNDSLQKQADASKGEIGKLKQVDGMLQNEISSGKEEIRELKRTGMKLQKEIDEGKDETEKLKKAGVKLQKELDLQKVELQKEIDEGKDEIEKLKKAGVKLQKELDLQKVELQKEIDLQKVELQKGIDEGKDETEKLKKAGVELQKEVDLQKVEIEELKRMMTVLLENVITDIRFGKIEIKDVFNGYGYKDGEGYVITGAINWDRDEDVDTLERRKVQKFVNGTWLNVY
jgi:uncharacterized coiled-coil DUF342 family protein